MHYCLADPLVGEIKKNYAAARTAEIFEVKKKLRQKNMTGAKRRKNFLVRISRVATLRTCVVVQS